MKIIRKATKEETKQYGDKAIGWVLNSNHFQNSKNMAATVVAEYLANQDGLSLFNVEERDQEQAEIIPFPAEHQKPGFGMNQNITQ